MKKLSILKKEYSLFIKVISMVVALISVTFSWFVFGSDAWVNPFDVNVTSVVDVYISSTDGDDASWSERLEVDTDSATGSITEFSGNGESLYRPVIVAKEIQKYYKVDTSDENINKSYLEIVSYVKSTGPIRFYLHEDSFVVPQDTTNPKDNIAGAVRVAFLVENHKPFIWAPNSTYQYIDNQDGTFTVNKNGTPESSYSYIYEDSDDMFISKDSLVEIDNSSLKEAGVSQDKRFVWGDLSSINNYESNADPIFTVVHLSQEEIIVKMTIRVWVEGTDREAIGTLVGGKINMNLKFNALAVEERG